MPARASREVWAGSLSPNVESNVSRPSAAPLFLVSLGVTLASARQFARRLDRLGVRFGFPEALIGLLTAIAADGPNVSSSLFALLKGAHDVGVGVLVGSNAFQLGAMIGVSALLAGAIRLPRETVLLEGVVGLVITLLAAALLLRWLSSAEAVAVAARGGSLPGTRDRRTAAARAARIEVQTARPRPPRAPRSRAAGGGPDEPDPTICSGSSCSTWR